MQSAPPDVIYRSDHLEILCHNPKAKRAVVVFDHRQVRSGGFSKIRPSSTITEAGNAYVTIASRANDWFLSPSLSDCATPLSDYMARFDRVVGFGSSMGGYGALALSRPCRFNQVMLVSPQITVFPEKPPYDIRFQDHATGLDQAFDTLGKNPRKGLGGVVLYDPHILEDRAHAQLIFEMFPRLKSVPLPFAGHPALGVISQEKKFWRIQSELISNNISSGRLLQLHKSLRQSSPLYQKGLSAYLKTRKAREGM